MFKFFKSDYKKLYAKEREDRWGLERDYNIVVSAYQKLLTDYYKLKDELEEERNNHDRLQDYAVEMDKREESLKAQVHELRSFVGVKEETV